MDFGPLRIIYIRESIYKMLIEMDGLDSTVWHSMASIVCTISNGTACQQSWSEKGPNQANSPARPGKAADCVQGLSHF